MTLANLLAIQRLQAFSASSQGVQRLLAATTKKRIDDCRDIFKNACLHGFADPHIVEYDIRRMEAKIKAAIDRVWGGSEAIDCKTEAQKEPLSSVAAEAVSPRGAVLPPIVCARSAC